MALWDFECAHVCARLERLHVRVHVCGRFYNPLDAFDGLVGL
jgi:hypothetical protein